MEQRRRQNEIAPSNTARASGNGSSVGEQARRLLEASDGALDRVLSRDSQAFVAANHQTVGE